MPRHGFPTPKDAYSSSVESRRFNISQLTSLALSMNVGFVTSAQSNYCSGENIIYPVNEAIPRVKNSPLRRVL